MLAMEVSCTRWNSDSVVDVYEASGYTSEGPCFHFRLRLEIFHFLNGSTQALGPIQHAIRREPDVKWSGSKPDHSPQITAVVKNYWSCNSTPTYAFMACRQPRLHACLYRVQVPAYVYCAITKGHTIRIPCAQRPTRHAAMNKSKTGSGRKSQASISG